MIGSFDFLFEWRLVYRAAISMIIKVCEFKL